MEPTSDECLAVFQRLCLPRDADYWRWFRPPNWPLLMWRPSCRCSACRPRHPPTGRRWVWKTNGSAAILPLMMVVVSAVICISTEMDQMHWKSRMNLWTPKWILFWIMLLRNRVPTVIGTWLLRVIITLDSILSGNNDSWVTINTLFCYLFCLTEDDKGWHWPSSWTEETVVREGKGSPGG